MTSLILQKNIRDPLYGHTAASFETALKEKLKNRVETAYFFGSYGTDAFNADSDIDLILIKQTDVSFFERAIEFLDLLDIVPCIDILVYTPEEFHRLTADPSPGFWQSVVATLRIL
ncbi:MAG: nucleotidyltransferase domain-containing protein [Deltaproteobacteria bacterium]|nr:nucleotidyltransferase domain-containing protein [Deltaproteobacteria bacterium]